MIFCKLYRATCSFWEKEGKNDYLIQPSFHINLRATTTKQHAEMQQKNHQPLCMKPNCNGVYHYASKLCFFLLDGSCYRKISVPLLFVIQLQGMNS